VAKVTSLSEFRSQTLIRERHAEFHNIVAQMSRQLQTLKSFVEKNGLTEAKSNSQTDAQLSELCRLDLASFIDQAQELVGDIETSECEADILPFRPSVKKIA
jgi:hypothetical protein